MQIFMYTLKGGGNSDLHHIMYTREEGGPKHRYLMFRWGDYRFNVLRERG